MYKDISILVIMQKWLTLIFSYQVFLIFYKKLTTKATLLQSLKTKVQSVSFSQYFKIYFSEKL